MWTIAKYLEQSDKSVQNIESSLCQSIIDERPSGIYSPDIFDIIYAYLIWIRSVFTDYDTPRCQSRLCVTSAVWLAMIMLCFRGFSHRKSLDGKNFLLHILVISDNFRKLSGCVNIQKLSKETFEKIYGRQHFKFGK